MSEIEVKTEDEVLDYTQIQREKIVNKLTANGVPGDTKELMVLLSTLDGMDRSALAKKKLKNDAGLADKFGLASAAITELLTNMRNEVRATSPASGEVEVSLPDDLPPPNIVPGELDTTNPNLTYHDVMITETNE